MDNTRNIMKTKDILIAIITKNVIKTIDKVLKNAFSYALYFNNKKILIIDGHSTDGTFEFCQEWCKNNMSEDFKVIKQKTNVLPRPLSLSEARNTYIDIYEPLFKKNTYLLVLDSDEINTNEIDQEGFISNFSYPLDSWDAMCANQSKIYYDIWALRNNECPYDCWEMVRKYSDETTYLRNHQVPKPITHPLIPCLSAFGGAVLYHTEKLKGCRYFSYVLENNIIKEICEHVPFNKMLHENGGKIFINPRFINSP